MKKYFTSTLWYTAYLFASVGIAYVVAPFLGIILILPFVEGKTGILVDIVNLTYNFLSMTVLPLTILYIAMHRVGNATYKEKSVKELLIPIIISVLLFNVIDVSVDFYFSKSISNLLIYFTVDTNELVIGESESVAKYLHENYYSLFILSAFLQSILFVLFMILGFYKGYSVWRKKV